jgi:hypothetical protein
LIFKYKFVEKGGCDANLAERQESLEKGHIGLVPGKGIPGGF